SHYNESHDILGLDIDTEALQIAEQKTGIKTQHCDLNADWNIEPASFDAVVACEVIEHLYHPDIVLDRIHTVLKPGGILVGSIPHAFNMQTRLKFLFGSKKLSPLADPTHINHFSASEFRNLLEKNFTDVEMVGVMTSKYQFLQKLLPFFFAHTLLFTGRKTSLDTVN
ncbi:MAG: methyltransferase domain-containing protein, partial [Calditrichaeota bacterium]|nr:methyltransferase domain-containing protein [Calditrichota bacterium]